VIIGVDVPFANKTSQCTRTAFWFSLLNENRSFEQTDIVVKLIINIIFLSNVISFTPLILGVTNTDAF
jgi:hypothetical protein